MNTAIEFRGSAGGRHGCDYPLAEAPEWAAFVAWVRRLPERSFPALRALATEGEVKGTAALATQLRRAMRYYACPWHVAHTARTLLRTLGDGHPGETATVGDLP